jgi:hypothetical protein
VVDALGDETRRQTYVPPAVASNTNPFASPPAPQYGYVPPTPQYGYTPPPTSQRRRILKWGLAGSALAIAMGLGAAMNDNHNNARISDSERALIEGARREGRLNDSIFRTFAETSSRSEREINDLVRKMDRARDDIRRAAERGTQTDLLGIPLLDLSKYEYPQATVSSAIRIPGKEMTRQHVKMDFVSLVRHYEFLLGKPVILQNGEDDDEKRALFQSADTPEKLSVSVFIRDSNDYNGQWEVMILRSPFRFPRTAGEKAPVLEAAESEIKGGVAPPIAPKAPNAKAASKENTTSTASKNVNE